MIWTIRSLTQQPTFFVLNYLFITCRMDVYGTQYSRNWKSCTRVQHGALVLKGTRWFGSTLEMAHLAIYVRKSLCVMCKAHPAS